MVKQKKTKTVHNKQYDKGLILMLISISLIVLSLVASRENYSSMSLILAISGFLGLAKVIWYYKFLH